MYLIGNNIITLASLSSTASYTNAKQHRQRYHHLTKHSIHRMMILLLLMPILCSVSSIPVSTQFVHQGKLLCNTRIDASIILFPQKSCFHVNSWLFNGNIKLEDIPDLPTYDSDDEYADALITNRDHY